MNSRAIRTTLLAASLACAGGAIAGNEVSKCTEPDGRVTLTDQGCPGTARAVVLATTTVQQSAPAAAVVEAQPAGADRYQLRALPPAPRMPSFSQPQAPGRALARDVATLKEARRTLLLLDATMSSARQQGLAAH